MYISFDTVENIHEVIGYPFPRNIIIIIIIIIIILLLLLLLLFLHVTCLCKHIKQGKKVYFQHRI